MEPKTLDTPDVTAIQKIVAAVSVLVAAGVGVVNAFDWATITATQSAALLGLWTALGSVLVLSDAVIRHGRSRAFSIAPKGVVAEDESAKTVTTRKPRAR